MRGVQATWTVALVSSPVRCMWHVRSNHWSITWSVLNEWITRSSTKLVGGGLALGRQESLSVDCNCRCSNRKHSKNQRPNEPHHRNHFGVTKSSANLHVHVYMHSNSSIQLKVRRCNHMNKKTSKNKQIITNKKSEPNQPN